MSELLLLLLLLLLCATTTQTLLFSRLSLADEFNFPEREVKRRTLESQPQEHCELLL